MKKTGFFSSQIRNFFIALCITVLAFMVSLLLNLSFYTLIFLIFGLLFFITIPIGLYQARGLRRVGRAMKRLIAEDTDSLIAEVGEEWAQGHHSVANALILSATYNHQGNGVEGEKYAIEAFTAIEKRGLSRKTDKVSRLLCELAAIVFYDARVAQGRFIEAAHYLRNQLPNAVQGNFLTVAVVCAFFFGQDEGNARAALALVKPPGGQRNQERWIPPKYLFLLAYLRHKLLGADMRPELNKLREQYPGWQKEVELNVANPYGVRLREIVDEIGELLASTA